MHGSHDPHHLPVGHRLIGANVERAIGTSGGDRAQLLGQGIGRHRRVVEEDLAALADVHDELLLLPGERPGRDLRQVDGHPLLQDRGRHHEDDEQHEHHVDERRDVDLRDRVRPGGRLVEGHCYFKK